MVDSCLGSVAEGLGMKYLLSVIDRVSGSATGDEIDAIDAFNERLVADGHWVMAAGIGAPTTATMFDNRGGAGIAAPGGYVDAVDYVAGFWIIDVPNDDTAQRLAAEGSRACNRRIELRPFLR